VTSKATIAALEANANALMAEIKMYGAANGELKDALDAAEAENERLLISLEQSDWASAQSARAELAAAKRILRKQQLGWEGMKAELADLNANHCRDCCCAQSWQALGVSEYDGKPISEHITALRDELAALKAENERMRLGGNCKHWCPDVHPHCCGLSRDADCGPFYHCIFTPSRWEEYAHE
jgi:hypothetical protein